MPRGDAISGYARDPVRSILFCNEMLGLGHIRLSLALAEALTADDDRATSLVVTGSPASGGMRLPPRVDLLKLPIAPVTPDSSWSATGMRPTAGLALDPVGGRGASQRPLGGRGRAHAHPT